MLADICRFDGKIDQSSRSDGHSGASVRSQRPQSGGRKYIPRSATRASAVDNM